MDKDLPMLKKLRCETLKRVTAVMELAHIRAGLFADSVHLTSREQRNAARSFKLRARFVSLLEKLQEVEAELSLIKEDSNEWVADVADMVKTCGGDLFEASAATLPQPDGNSPQDEAEDLSSS